MSTKNRSRRERVEPSIYNVRRGGRARFEISTETAMENSGGKRCRPARPRRLHVLHSPTFEHGRDAVSASTESEADIRRRLARDGGTAKR